MTTAAMSYNTGLNGKPILHVAWIKHQSCSLAGGLPLKSTDGGGLKSIVSQVQPQTHAQIPSGHQILQATPTTPLAQLR